MRRRSVRTRITILATGVSLVVLAVVGVLVVLAVETQLRSSLDRSLEQRADQVETVTHDAPGRSIVNTDTEDRFAQVLDADGVVIVATDNVAGQPALFTLPTGDQLVGDRSDLPLEDDTYRVLIRRFDVGDETHFVVVGENVDDMNDGTRAVGVTLAVAFPIVAVLIGALTWWLVGRTLRPVETMRREVAAIGLGDLDHRVPTPGTGDEIDRLATTMNEMLARLETSASQQSTFVSDVSHELRTPLTRLRTMLEVDLSPSMSNTVDFEATAIEALSDVVDMQQLVDDLLFLARIDAGRARLPSEPVDLEVVVESEIASLRPTTSIVIETDVLRPVQVVGNERQLARLCRNLLENAVRHAERRVVVALTEHAGSAYLAVEDDGPGIPLADRDRVFDRFVRLDTARTPDGGSTGLGLAIVADIVRLHGGAVAVADGDTVGGARLEVRLPSPAGQSTVE